MPVRSEDTTSFGVEEDLVDESLLLLISGRDKGVAVGDSGGGVPPQLSSALVVSLEDRDRLAWLEAGRLEDLHPGGIWPVAIDSSLNQL